MPATHGVQGTETFRCATDDNLMMYTATNVPTDFFDETPFVSGSIRISVLDSCVYDNNYINMIAGDAKIIDSNVGNGMTVRKATRTLIAMRVIDSRNVGPTSSKEVFADKIFGTNGDVFNLVSSLSIVFFFFFFCKNYINLCLSIIYMIVFRLRSVLRKPTAIRTRNL